MATNSKTRNSRSAYNHRRAPQAAEDLRHFYQQAGRSARDLQEKAGGWWRDVFGSGDWQKQVERLTQIATSSVPLTQRNVGQWMDFLEKSSRTNAKLMNDVVDAIQTATTSESQAKWMELWTCGHKAVQSNLVALSELSAQTIDSWTGFVRKTSDLASSRAM